MTYWFEEIVGFSKELPLVCPVCGDQGYIIDTGGNKNFCGCQGTGGVFISSFEIEQTESIPILKSELIWDTQED